MAAKEINFVLSVKSVEKAIKELEEYRETLKNKTIELLNRLAELGYQIAESGKYGEGDTDESNIYPEIGQVEYIGDNVRVPLLLNGEGVAFIEFGAGVYYNGAVGTSPNPNGAELGYVIGSYGLGNGAREYWFHDGGIISFGTEAAMPLYKAQREIVAQAGRIAKEVFG